MRKFDFLEANLKPTLETCQNLFDQEVLHVWSRSSCKHFVVGIIYKNIKEKIISCFFLDRNILLTEKVFSFGVVDLICCSRRSPTFPGRRVNGDQTSSSSSSSLRMKMLQQLALHTLICLSSFTQMTGSMFLHVPQFFNIS